MTRLASIVRTLYLQPVACLLLAGCVGQRLDVAAASSIAADRVERATGLRPRAAVTLIQGRMSCNGVVHAYGCTSWNGRHTAVSTDIPDQETLEKVLVHEGLHAIGCHDHVLAGQGILARVASSDLPRITWADLQLVCSQVVCKKRRAE